jgi:hypothetical protein
LIQTCNKSIESNSLLLLWRQIPQGGRDVIPFITDPILRHVKESECMTLRRVGSSQDEECKPGCTIIARLQRWDHPE